MPPTTDMHNVLIAIASIEADNRAMRERLEAMDGRMDERFEGLQSMHSERQEMSRLLLTHTVATAVDAAVRTHLAPLAAKVERLEEHQVEARALIKTAAKAATLMGGGISLVWGVVQALLLGH